MLRGPASKLVSKVTRALQRREVPDAAAELPEEARSALVELARCDADRTAIEAGAQLTLDRDNIAVAEAIQAVASEPRFREALLWQNRAAVHATIASLLRRPVDAIGSKTREQRRVVASSLQRYSLKNDTIGFFGPVGWARFTAAAGIEMRAGDGLVSTRTTYFEYWCIDALAQHLAKDPALRPFLRPRRTPSIWIEGTTLLHPNGQRAELPAPYARLLGEMDGARTARELATIVIADPRLEIADEAEAFECLGELANRKLCSWTIEIPTATFRPEGYLRAAVEGAEGAARGRAIAALDQLEAKRSAVQAAAGDPERLDLAIGELEATFEALTGMAATRKGGQTYAGRTLVFEDCRRDLVTELGSGVLAQIAAPLALVLTSARWYTHEIAVRYEREFRRVFDELRGTATSVRYVAFRERLPVLFPGAAKDHGIAHDVAKELRAKWDELVGLDTSGERVLERTSTELASAVARTFAAPGPGWPSARHHSPDLMIAAASAEAIQRGDFYLVLGELHVGFNTVTLPCLVKEHPDPEVLVHQRELDLVAPNIAPVWSKARNRADFFSLSHHDFDLETGETVSARARDHVLASGGLQLHDEAGRLVVRSPEGVQFDLTAFLEQHLIAEGFARFRLLSKRPHVPRVTIDRLVIQRETWHFDAAALSFAAETTELGRFAMARQLMVQYGMPRRVYVKTDTESKPFFIDFESPLLVEIFARQLKRSSTVVISEMAPTLDECWVVDGGGERYTSELRIVATDAVAWQPGA